MANTVFQYLEVLRREYKAEFAEYNPRIEYEWNNAREDYVQHFICNRIFKERLFRSSTFVGSEGVYEFAKEVYRAFRVANQALGECLDHIVEKDSAKRLTERMMDYKQILGVLKCHFTYKRTGYEIESRFYSLNPDDWQFLPEWFIEYRLANVEMLPSALSMGHYYPVTYGDKDFYTFTDYFASTNKVSSKMMLFSESAFERFLRNVQERTDLKNVKVNRCEQFDATTIVEYDVAHESSKKSDAGSDSVGLYFVRKDKAYLLLMGKRSSWSFDSEEYKETTEQANSFYLYPFFFAESCSKRQAFIEGTCYRKIVPECIELFN